MHPHIVPNYAVPYEYSTLCVCVCVQVYEAYGQTECTAGCTFTTPGDWTPGEPGVYATDLFISAVNHPLNLFVRLWYQSKGLTVMWPKK